MEIREWIGRHPKILGETPGRRTVLQAAHRFCWQLDPMRPLPHDDWPGDLALTPGHLLALRAGTKSALASSSTALDTNPASTPESAARMRA
jgi:hypothetical protein